MDNGDLICPCCGYYCLGNGGIGCIDKPSLLHSEVDFNNKNHGGCMEILQELLVSPARAFSEWLKNKIHGYVPVLCLDFDGVLHSYSSGWKGASNIPDPPVKGAIEWLDSLVEDGEAVCAMAPRFRDFDVCIYSSRSSQWGGRRAMRKWLVKHGFREDKIENIKFPLFKPPAQMTIDDRAFCFKGNFPSVDEMKHFKPWNKKKATDI